MTREKQPSILMVHSRSSWGGNTSMVLALCRGLHAEGFRVGLAAHPEQPYIPYFIDAGIGVHIVSIGGKSDLWAPLRLASLIRKHSYDIIHSHTRPADLAAVPAGKITSIPVVITQHGNVNLDRTTLERQRGLFAFAYNLVLRGASRIVAVCNATRRELIAYCGVKNPNISVIYNGIETKNDLGNRAETTIKIRQELGIAQNAVVCLITGAIHWKGHEVLASALAMLKEELPQLVILSAGVGPGEEQLRRQIRELGIVENFRLLGFRSDVPDLLMTSDIFVLPSRSEAFPVSILEAMRFGLPVIASSIGGIPEQIIDGVNGILVPVGDAARLAGALRLLAHDTELRQRMGARGKVMVPQFSLREMIQGYLSVYRELLGLN